MASFSFRVRTMRRCFLHIVDMRKWLLPAFVSLVLILLLLSPERYFLSVQGAVLLFASSVLPSMLPYFFFTKLLTATGCVGALTATVGKPLGRAYKLSPVVAYPFLMSLLSGYPVGARVLSDLYQKGLIDRDDALHAASFTSTSGSMFVLGSVGAVILKDIPAAVVILVSHYLGAFLNGFLYRGKRAGHTLPMLVFPESESLLSDAMYESVLSLAAVGGFIAVANLVGDMVLDLLSLCGIGRFLEDSVGGALLYSLFEVTRGCVEFGALGMGRIRTAALCCLAVSFGGLSVLLQSLAFLGKTGLKAPKYLLMKTTQAALSFALCVGLGFLFLR